MLSLIIPTLKTPDGFSARLEQLCAHVDEVILAAADETDPGVQAVLADPKVRVISGEKGRGQQLFAGAQQAKGTWFLFLHADTDLEQGWRLEIEGFIKHHPDQAGYFQFKLDDEGPAAQRLEKTVQWRCRTFGLPYGDQGLLISKKLYDDCGGYPRISLMEDVALVRKIGRRNLVGLRSRAITSAAKYQKGYNRRSLRNLFCLCLYFIGVPVDWIKKVYG